MSKPRTALSPAQEKFCQLMVAGTHTQVDAYTEAYGSMARKQTRDTQASRMMKRDDIKARIEEIRAPTIKQVRKSFKYGLEDAIKQCEDLLRNDVDGIHFYTLNKSKATVEICKALDIPHAA